MHVKQPNGLPVRTLAEAHAAVQAATDAYAVAKGNADHARKSETAALNELNNAQKVFDNAVQAERSAAPNQSDWRMTPALRVPVLEPV